MLHIALHIVVPLLIVAAFYRRRWREAVVILTATMLVDLDHLIATPIYDPERCSIGFHPLHDWPAIALYVALFALPPLLPRRKSEAHGLAPPGRWFHLVGLGLLVHMALDWSDCMVW